MTVVASILSLPISRIAVGERVGFYHADHAAALAESIAAEGQHDPIHVQAIGGSAWALVAGLHRLRAMEIAGGDTILALQVADAATDAATLLRLELSENLDHRQPRPIERAIFMAARARAEEAIDHPDHVGESQYERTNRLRWDHAAPSAARSDWRERTAAAFGVKLRAFEKYQAIHRNIVEPLPALAEQLNAHALGGNLAGLLRIAKMETVQGRQRVIDAILADPDIPSFDEAFFRIGAATSKGRRETIDGNKVAVAFMEAWRSMPLARQRASFADQLRNSSRTTVQAMVEELRAWGAVK